ncbi:hypothetical protein ACFOU2_21605 [Bacillus songklensis]|uniref:Uncharacterized protein n=1 Tax=Bacillus songklensis TaxID=1069116 RepID=A0ABV8B6I7_9BACI
MLKEQQTVVFESKDENDNLIVDGKISGESEVQYHDDLKLKAVIALLNSVDQQHFQASEKTDLFSWYMGEIEQTLQAIRKHNRFQGNEWQ